MSSENMAGRGSPNSGRVAQMRSRFEERSPPSQHANTTPSPEARPSPSEPRSLLSPTSASTSRPDSLSRGSSPQPPLTAARLQSPSHTGDSNSHNGASTGDSEVDGGSKTTRRHNPRPPLPPRSHSRPPSSCVSHPLPEQPHLKAVPSLSPTSASASRPDSLSRGSSPQSPLDVASLQSPSHTGDFTSDNGASTGGSEVDSDSAITRSDNGESSQQSHSPPSVPPRGHSLPRGRGGAIHRKTHVYKVFTKTKADLADNSAKERGQAGLCSKCKGLSSPVQYKQTAAIVSDWATPLSRVLYHGTWCVLCRLIVNTLCEREYDPLLHPAVAGHVQPQLRGHTMQTWAEKGWEYNDENWPFGHGLERHEGETYVLDKAFEGLETAFRKAFRAVTDYGIGKLSDRDMTLKDSFIRTLQKNLNEHHDTKQYRLSCVLKITRFNPKNPSFLLATLWGYGRGKDAQLQVLSSFPLRLASSEPVSHLRGLLAHRHGKLLDPHWIDPSVGRSWLKECEENHGAKCSVPGWASAVDRPEFLRVVDVKNYCVKPIGDPRRCRYIALSYVWGECNTVTLTRTNQDILKKNNSLLQWLSPTQQTIVDAIEAVRAMGVDYLWVDVLCIVQDDRNDAQQHIDKMDQIYSSALATIVAADGNDVSHGLVGIKSIGNEPGGKPREVSPASAKISDTLYLCAPLSTREYRIDASKWNSRAWTYQERLLSRRLITFINGEIIWYCRGMTCREDMKTDDSRIPMPHLDWITLREQNFGGDVNPNWREGCIEITRFGKARLVRPTAFEQYVKAVEEYAHRERKIQNDVLKAFAGMTQIFSVCLKSSAIFGLPESVLDVALLWKPTEALERRKDFPSWSWCGWIGRVTYPKTFVSAYDNYYNFLSCVAAEAGEEGIQTFILWHTCQRGRLVPVNGTGRGFSSSHQAETFDWQRGPSCVHENGIVRPVATFPAMPWPPTDMRLRSQCLYFWTSASADIRIGQPIDQPSDRQSKDYYSERSSHFHPPWRLQLLSKYSEVVGNVLLDGLDYEWTKNKRYEFLQIAEAKFEDRDNEPRNIPGFPLYLVMMVEWNEDWTVATRLGIGRLYKEAWNVSQPRLTFVQLA